MEEEGDYQNPIKRLLFNNPSNSNNFNQQISQNNLDIMQEFCPNSLIYFSPSQNKIDDININNSQNLNKSGNNVMNQMKNQISQNQPNNQ